MISPFPMVPKAFQIVALMFSLKKWTLASAMHPWTPPGCRLRLDWKVTVHSLG